MKNFIIVALAAALAFTSVRLAHVENQRYAMLLGICGESDVTNFKRFDCLDKVETRTSWVWNLYYGLTYF